MIYIQFYLTMVKHLRKVSMAASGSGDEPSKLNHLVICHGSLASDLSKKSLEKSLLYIMKQFYANDYILNENFTNDFDGNCCLYDFIGFGQNKNSSSRKYFFLHDKHFKSQRRMNERKQNKKKQRHTENQFQFSMRIQFPSILINKM